MASFDWVPSSNLGGLLTKEKTEEEDKFVVKPKSADNNVGRLNSDRCQIPSIDYNVNVQPKSKIESVRILWQLHRAFLCGRLEIGIKLWVSCRCCSTMASYNSLLDPHLSAFFASARVRRHLRKAGLVSTELRQSATLHYNKCLWVDINDDKLVIEMGRCQIFKNDAISIRYLRILRYQFRCDILL